MHTISLGLHNTIIKIDLSSIVIEASTHLTKWQPYLNFDFKDRKLTISGTETNSNIKVTITTPKQTYTRLIPCIQEDMDLGTITLDDGTSEVEYLAHVLTPLLKDVRDYVSLTADDKEILHCQTKFEKQQIENFIQAQLLSQRLKKAPLDLCYGLIQQQKTSDIDQLALLTADGLKDSLSKAVAEQIIPAQDLEKPVTELKAILDEMAFREVKDEDQILAPLFKDCSVNPKQCQIFLRLKAEYAGAMNSSAFWTALESSWLDPSNKLPNATDENIRVRLQTLKAQTKLISLTKEQPLVVETLLPYHQPEKLIALVDGLDGQTLSQVVKAAYISKDYPGGVQQYRTDFTQNVHVRLSQERFKLYLQRDFIKLPSGNLTNIFFQANPTFKFGGSFAGLTGKHTLGLIKLPDGLSDQEKVLLSNNLRAINRLWKIVPNGAEVDLVPKMLGNKIFSAAQIVNSYTPAGFEKIMLEGVNKESKAASILCDHCEKVYGAAANQNARVAAGIQRVRSQVGNNNPAVVPDYQDTVTRAREGQSSWSREELEIAATLENLIGSLDACSCDQCNSVHSPVAYFVDTIQFLEKVETDPASDGAYKELIERRPDIIKTPLSCKNTNTIVPHIDLCLELLENMAAEKMKKPEMAYSSFDTTWSAAELLAHPENINHAVYEGLKNTVTKHHWHLPFNFYREEQNAYLKDSGYDRHLLRKTFRSSTPSDEYLLLSALDYFQVTNLTDITSPAILNNSATDSIKIYLEKLFISYEELLELLEMNYVSGQNQSISILYGEDCDLNKSFFSKDGRKKIDNRQDQYFKNFLKRLIIAKRLLIKSGWNHFLLDVCLSKAEELETTFSEQSLILLYQIGQLAERLHVDIDQAAQFFSAKLSTKNWTNEQGEIIRKSIFNQAFNERTILPEVRLNAFFAALGSDALLKDFTDVLTSGLGISETDINTFTPLLANTNLSEANVTLLWQYWNLATSLGVSSTELADTYRFFSSIKVTSLFSAEHTKLSDFLDLLDLLRRSKASADQLTTIISRGHKTPQDKKVEIETLISSVTAPIGIDDSIEITEADRLAAANWFSNAAADISHEVMRQAEIRQLPTEEYFLYLLQQKNRREDWSERKKDLANLLSVDLNCKLVEKSRFSESPIRFFLDWSFHNGLKSATAAYHLSLQRSEISIPLEVFRKVYVSLTAYEQYLAKLAIYLKIDETTLNALITIKEKDKLGSHLLTFCNWSNFITTIIANRTSSEDQEATFRQHLREDLNAFEKAAQTVKLLNLSAVQLIGYSAVADKWDLYPLFNTFGTATSNQLLRSLYLTDAITNAPHPEDAFRLLTLWSELSELSDAELTEGVDQPLGQLELLVIDRLGIDIDHVQNINAVTQGEKTVMQRAYRSYLRTTGYVQDNSSRQNWNGWAISLFLLTDVLSKATSIPLSALGQRDHLLTSLGFTSFSGENIKPTKIETYFDFEYFLSNGFRSMQNAYHSLTATGLNQASVSDLLTSQNDEQLSNEIKAGYRRRLGDKNYLQQAPAVRNILREKQRDALTAYLITYDVKGLNWKTPTDIYNYLMVDVMTNSCMPSSRIVFANATLQKYIDRILLNMEPLSGGKPSSSRLSSESTKEWEWRKEYRVWEANKKVFLYPENWLRPELRKGKSEQYEQFEKLLNQSVLNDDEMQSVYLDYIKSLFKLVGLEIAAFYSELDGNNEIFHFIGRSQSHPRDYYYRKYVKDQSWTTWSIIPHNIDGENIAFNKWGDSLIVFWITTQVQPVEKGENTSSSSSSETNPKETVIHLSSILFSNKKWSQIKTIKNVAQFKHDAPTQLSESVYIYSKVNFLKRKIDLLFLRPNLTDWSYSATAAISIDPLTLSFAKINNFSNTEFVRIQKFVEKAKQVSKSLNGEIYVSTEPIRNLTSLDLSPNTSGQPDFTAENYSITLPSVIFNSRSNPSNTLCISSFEKSFLFHRYYNDFREIITNIIRVHNPLVLALSRHASSWVLNRKLEYVDLASRGSLNDLENILVSRNNTTTFLSTNTNFEIKDSSSTYNWELFLHIPLAIATKLIDNQQYEQAQKWLHFIFDPTTGKTEDVNPIRRFWKIKPFYQFNGEMDIRNILRQFASGEFEDADNDGYWDQLKKWEDNPFDPHAIAEHRISTYMLTVLMKYLDNLVAWGDMEFRKGTLESRNSAFRKYIIAHQLLGRKPVLVKKSQDIARQSYDQLVSPEIDDYGDIRLAEEWQLSGQIANDKNRFLNGIRVKNIQSGETVTTRNEGRFSRLSVKAGDSIEVTEMGARLLASFTIGNQAKIAIKLGKRPQGNQFFEEIRTPGKENSWQLVEDAIKPQPHDSTDSKKDNASLIGATKSSLYFCVPSNPKMLGYWDTVEDRLFKIRNCFTIDGTFSIPALFAPEIDPGVLVNAAYNGSLNEAIAQINTIPSVYRFSFLLRKTKELINEVKQLGDKVLSAIEKRDGEAISLKRQLHEISGLRRATEIRELSLQEATKSLESVEVSIQIAELKLEFFSSKKFMNSLEVLEIAERNKAMIIDTTAQAVSLASIPATQAPEVEVVSTAMPGVNTKFPGGGSANSNSSAKAVAALQMAATFIRGLASNLGTMASYQRRKEEWDHQKELTKKELKQLEKQLSSAELRLRMAEKELTFHHKQEAEAKEIADLMELKFSNADLYDWQAAEYGGYYRSMYNLAVSMLKKTARAFEFETGISFNIKEGHWNSLRKGLSAGDSLLDQATHMEEKFLDLQNNKQKEQELTDHLSISVIDAEALQELKRDGECMFSIPEAWLDILCPGHYNRKITSVSLTIPAIIGNNGSIHATLTLLKSEIRVDPSLDSQPKAFNVVSDSITTSSAINDSGRFELNFRDEKYLPFEGRGVISTWHLQIPNFKTNFKVVDYDSINDVTLSINYTAKSGGAAFQKKVIDSLEKTVEENGKLTTLAIDLRKQFPHLIPELKAKGKVTLKLEDKHFPFVFREFKKSLESNSEGFEVVEEGASHVINISVVVDNNFDKLPLLYIIKYSLGDRII